MSVTTHCLPNNTLGTAELPVPSINSGNCTFLTPNGAKRGVVVNLHGLTTSPQTFPLQIVDAGGILPSLELTLSNDLVSDGWVVMYPSYAEDFYVGVPSNGLYNDIANDAGHGSRYLTNTLHWWDHVVEFIQSRYGNVPIVPWGFSWGGWHTFQIAANKSSTILAYGSHHAATVLSQASPVWTKPTDYSGLNTSGLDTTTNMLNGLTTTPGIIGWGTVDSAVGYTNIQAIYNAAHGAGCPVVSNGVNEEHVLTSSDVTTYMNWFTGTVDPLAPAIF